ncbi:MAG TPA: efflux RND transporter periplasmic adaptor subunit [Solirubrobacteraceae bacterium]
MRPKRRVLTAAGALIVVAAGGGILLSGGQEASAGPAAASVSSAPVQKGKLSAAVSQDGTLTYRARPDGSPFSAINHARGTYTALPEVGDEVDCGDVLYRVDDRPVLLLCGTLPAYRALHVGDGGQDVHQLNRSLHLHGAGGAFTAKTQSALEALQRRRHVHVTGALALGDAVFLPAAVRIAKVAGELGGLAQPGAQVLTATSDTLHVQVNLDPSDQGQVKRGDRAQITLPGNTTLTGKVDGFGRVAESAGQGASAAAATIPTYISLDDPAKAGGLDQAPVGVDVTTAGVDSALSVPVTALVGKSGGGFAVEVVRAGARRDLVAVHVGLFDTAGGRVQVEGALRAGDRVAVPSL